MKIQTQPDYLIFAEDAKTGELQAFPGVSRGWGVTIDQTQSKPPMEWMNGAFNRVDKNMLYLLQQGIPEWNSAVLYPIGAVIKYKNTLYLAKLDNDNAIPSTNTSKWDKLINDGSTTQKGIVKLNSAINSTSEADAATPKAVKVAYDLASATKVTAETAATTAVAGRVQLSSAINSASENTAATSKAVKAISDKIDAFTGGVYVGEIRLLPFRSTELPSGWYFCNGSNVTTSSNVGQKLQSLSTNFKNDWGIKVSGSNINLPNLLNTNDGGYFLRPVDGASRQVGSIQTDAIKKFDGSFKASSRTATDQSSGVFKSVNTDSWAGHSSDTYKAYFNTVSLDLSTMNTANENRPVNIGMTPAIYLGV